MNIELIAQNIKRLRVINRISQRALAESSGISIPAIKKLEGAKSEPRVNTLRALSKSLKVQLQELLQPIPVLRNVRFRSNKRMRNREKILNQVAQWLGNFNYLEKILNDRIEPIAFFELCHECPNKNPVNAAAICRQKLGLNSTEPIKDICGVLENAGIKVLSIPYASNDFFGLCVGRDDGGPAIVVNAWEKVTVERRIFSAAHELGHLALHQHSFDIDRTEEDKGEEAEANSFAGYFLMPNEGFIKIWEGSAGLSMIDRVFKIKRIYSVSYKTVLYRLIELGRVDKNIWGKFNFLYQKQFNKKLGFKEEPQPSTEPYGLKPIDFLEGRFSRLVRQAVEGDEVSLSRGAEILKITIDEMQERLVIWETIL